MPTYNVFYSLELEGYIEVTADSPEAAEEIARSQTPIADLMDGVNLEGGRVSNVEAQVDGEGNPS